MNHLSKAQIQNDPGEKEWWDKYDPAKYPRPRMAVDVVILTVKDDLLHAVLVQRQHYPEKGMLALPGVFVRAEESLDEAARRALSTKVHLEDVYLEQLYTFGDPDRDPRERVISVTYYALADEKAMSEKLAYHQDAILTPLHVSWPGEIGGPVQAVNADGEMLELAFDHEHILGVCIKRIRGKLTYMPIGFELVGSEFTLRHLQGVYQTVLGKPLNKDSFRRKILQSGLVHATGEMEKETSHRPAELYRLIPAEQKEKLHG